MLTCVCSWCGAEYHNTTVCSDTELDTSCIYILIVADLHTELELVCASLLLVFSN